MSLRVQHSHVICGKMLNSSPKSPIKSHVLFQIPSILKLKEISAIAPRSTGNSWVWYDQQKMKP
jgi:hypothetical protein